MPRFDFQCPGCAKRKIDVILTNWDDAVGNYPQCEECFCIMDKLPSAPNFSIKGYNAKNGYSK